MPTQHLHRIFGVCTAARQAAVNTRIRNQLDPTGDNWFRVPLAATAAGPATHYMMSAALTNSELLALVGWLYQQAGGTLPSGATWNGWTRAEKRMWIRNTAIPQIRTWGVWLQHSDNDGDWESPDDELAQRGMVRVDTE